MQNLNQKFWADFAKTTWEKKLVTIKNIQSPLLQMDQTTIFDLLVTYSDRCRKLKIADGMKFYLHGHRQFESEVLRHLPKRSDKTLFGYHERMDSQYEDYCLVCDELLQVNHDENANLADFTSDLFAQVGLPNRFAEMGLYLGNYRKTPFGVHEDSCGVFSFPIVGVKRFRIWEPEFVKNNPKLAQSFSYAKFKESSQVLEAHVGDMAYWPSSAWHIAESNGSFSATWSLGVWIDKKHSDVVSEITSKVYTDLLGEKGLKSMTKLPAVNAAGEVESLPSQFTETLSLLQRLTAEQMQSAFRQSWLAHSSKQGFKIRPPADLTLKASSIVKLRNQKRPVLWMKDDAQMIYAFNGAIMSSKSKQILKFIASVNAGKALQVPKEFGLLATLADAGAFVNV